ncbi:MAG: hypothetical protein ACPHL6_12985, partial [Rubripirellula sp.]
MVNLCDQDAAVVVHRMAHQLVVNPKATQDCGHVMMANQEAVEKAFRQQGEVDSILLVLSRCESCGCVLDRSGRTPTSLHAPTIRTWLSPSNLFADSRSGSDRS